MDYDPYNDWTPESDNDDDVNSTENTEEQFYEFLDDSESCWGLIAKGVNPLTNKSFTVFCVEKNNENDWSKTRLNVRGNPFEKWTSNNEMVLYKLCMKNIQGV